ncbi:MAG: hypothetical protein PSY14_11395 [bacterium]|nr:hypothetical protein [bacterium]
MSLTTTFNGATNSDQLMDAVKNSDLETVKKLLALGADLNITAPTSGNFTGMGDLPLPAPPDIPKQPLPQKFVVNMATEREITAPPTARFTKKPQKRQTTL